MNSEFSLTKTDLGHLRHIERLAKQLPGDWSNMGSDWWDIGEGAQQYILAFMAYTLGIVQHRHTPAYREFCDSTLRALIDKMMLPDIWEKWINASRGGKVVDPDQKELGAGWIDPLKRHNIMFKGHLLQMAALHEMLYRTGTYAQDGAFTFEFLATTWGNGDEVFRYDLKKLARIVYDEYVESNYEGVQCEPNRVFPMCNQHALLGLRHFDQAFNTEYASDVMPKFKAAWERKGYTDCKTGSHMRLRHVRQDTVYPTCHPWADGWTGVFMHAWDPDFIEELYPRQRESHLESILAGDEPANFTGGMVPTTAKIGFAMFTALAAEVGDRETRDRLLEQADQRFSPVWDEGRFYYPRSDNWTPADGGPSRGIDTLSGNALLPMARLNDGNALVDLYSRPWSTADRNSPHIADVDQQVAGVSSAHYDAPEDSLRLAFLPGPHPGDLTFTVRGLTAGKSYQVLVDDDPVGSLEGKADPIKTASSRGTGSTFEAVRIDARQPRRVVITPAA